MCSPLLGFYFFNKSIAYSSKIDLLSLSAHFLQLRSSLMPSCRDEKSRIRFSWFWPSLFECCFFTVQSRLGCLLTEISAFLPNFAWLSAVVAWSVVLVARIYSFISLQGGEYEGVCSPSRNEARQVFQAPRTFLAYSI